MLKTRTVSANFHLTNRCNLRCGYCYAKVGPGPAMRRETADRAIDFSRTYAQDVGAEHLEVVFFGGEPLLELDLLCHVVDQLERTGDDAMRRSYKTSTNGLLLDDAAIEALATRGVYVSISIDGDPEVQDRQRPDVAGRPTSDRLGANIERLLRWNPCATVQCVVTPASAGRLDTSVAWLADRGFAYITTALDHGATWTRADLKQLEAAYERLADWYVARTRGGEKFYLSCFDERIRTRAHGPVCAEERCALGYRQFSIGPSGRLYPCVQFVGNEADDRFVLGDVEAGFDEARRSAIYGCSEREKPECGGCDLSDRCSSWCACVNWQSTGHLDRASPLVCAHEQLLMPIADRAANRLWKARNPLFLHRHYNPASRVRKRWMATTDVEERAVLDKLMREAIARGALTRLEQAARDYIRWARTQGL